ncbi:putative B6 ABC transporter permease subunit 2 [Pseudochelatococcus sp. B33]
MTGRLTGHLATGRFLRGRFLRVVAGPLLAALLLTAGALAVLGVDPAAYFGQVVQRGLLSPSGLQAAVTRMAPLLLLAASLILAFRAGIWNLGGDGQYLLGAVIAAAVAPLLAGALPLWLAWLACFAAAAAVGAAWSVLPAWLRAFRGINEVVSSLMMSFLGLSLANVLIKFVFQDPGTTVPQTVTLPVAERLPRLPGGAVSSGVLLGLAAVLLVHWVMTRTAFGLRLRIVGLNARAAAHAGLDVPWLTLTVFALSAGLAGLAGAVDVLGVQGNVRADWNPAYGLMVVPLVFLARLNGISAIVFVFIFSVLSVGGESAARRLGVPNYVTLMIVAILLIALAAGEALDQRAARRPRAGPGEPAP